MNRICGQPRILASARAQRDDLAVLERDDDERLVVLGRAVSRETLQGLEERLLEDVRAPGAAREDHALEPLEAERLALVVERFDEAVAVEDEPVAGIEPDFELPERLAPPHTERKSPRRQQLE